MKKTSVCKLLSLCCIYFSCIFIFSCNKKEALPQQEIASEKAEFPYNLELVREYYKYIDNLDKGNYDTSKLIGPGFPFERDLYLEKLTDNYLNYQIDSLIKEELKLNLN